MRATQAESRRKALLAWLEGIGANSISTVSIARVALADGQPIYFGRHADEGHATCRRDLAELEYRGKVTRSQNYNGPARWSVAAAPTNTQGD